jgi:hypothetical protein
MTAWPGDVIPRGEEKGIVIGGNQFIVPATQTFHTSMVDYLCHRLREQWIAKEREKPASDRHEVVRWLDALHAEIRDTPAQPGTDIVVRWLSGTTRALTLLADDIIQLDHFGRLSPRLLRRLRGSADEARPLSFQGVRYELLVAALFCRAGFTIDWIKPDANKKTPEFSAFLPRTGERFVVEAKSIHRPDALHGGGEAASWATEERSRALTVFTDALTHAQPGTPLLVFVDMNLPASSWPTEKENRYMADIEAELEAREAGGGPEEDCAAVFLTNFGWYFHGTEEPLPGGTLTHRVDRSKHVVSGHVLGLLGQAAQESGTIPDEEEHRRRVKERFPEIRGNPFGS